jgi:anaerobic selenocysteine-containing dehydrogenase
VVPPTRPWERGFRSRIAGYGLVRGEVPTGIMADEILEPGPGRIRGFFCHGGNVAVVVPDQAKVVKALRALDLLVTIDVYWNPTCELSDYVLPVLLPYERPDLTCWQAEQAFYAHAPFARYTRAVARPPTGSAITTDEYIFWGLARRLGITLQWLEQDLDMAQPPRTDDLLRIVVERGPVAFEDLQAHEMGRVFEEFPQFVEPGEPGPGDRFHLCPIDIREELAEVLSDPPLEQAQMLNGERATHRFIVRRHRDMWNSTQRALHGTRRRIPYNMAWMNPDDLQAIGAGSGEPVRLTSRIAAVDVIAVADETMRRGSVSMTHGFGVLPENNRYFEHGVSPNVLIGTRNREDHQTINAMPLMSSFPVHIAKGVAAGSLHVREPA